MDGEGRRACASSERARSGACGAAEHSGLNGFALVVREERGSERARERGGRPAKSHRGSEPESLEGRRQPPPRQSDFGPLLAGPSPPSLLRPTPAHAGVGLPAQARRITKTQGCWRGSRPDVRLPPCCSPLPPSPSTRPPSSSPPHRTSTRGDCSRLTPVPVHTYTGRRRRRSRARARRRATRGTARGPCRRVGAGRSAARVPP